MDTTTILGFRHRSQITLLLESLVTSENWVSPTARKVTDRSELPAGLQRIVIQAVKGKQEWVAWIDNNRPRLYVTAPAREYSRSMRRAALNLRIYNDRGVLRHNGLWVIKRDGGWRLVESQSFGSTRKN